MTVPSNNQAGPAIFARMTLREARRAAAGWLQAAGIETPEIDARFLLMEAARLSHSELAVRGSDQIMPDVARDYRSFLKRRASGEPVDSILGHQEFYGRRFLISKDVLSPRPETESVVDLALAHIKTMNAPRILDLGTGSGAIMISILAERADASGVGTDVSEAALDVAKTNAARHDVSARCQWIQSDWYEDVEDTFDLIVSNPPYITDAAMRDLAREVQNFDPDLALRGGKDGLDAYRKITANVMDFIRPGGALIVEIGYDQGNSVPALFEEAGLVDVKLLQDLSGHDRVVIGVRPKN